MRYFIIFLITVTNSFAGIAQDHKVRAEKALETLQKWYNEESGLWETTSWWNAANAITAIVDYSRITGSKKYLEVIDNTFETCKKFEVEMPNPEDNWICTNFINDYYDDEGWWILAWINAYDLTENEKYLDMSQVTFADMASGWDNVCKGGVYWKKPDKGKSAIQNEVFMLSAIRLFERTRDYYYLEWALKTWKWFRDSGMINDKYLVENGLNSECEVNPGRIYTYNQAMILSALVELDTYVREDLTSLAKKMALSSMENLTYDNGILKEPHEPNLNGDASQFKGIYMRYLADLYTKTKMYEIKDFIVKNANSIWDNARDQKTNEIGAVWIGPLDKADASRQSSALDAINGAIIVNE